MNKIIWVKGRFRNKNVLSRTTLSEGNFRKIIKNCSKNRWCNVIVDYDRITFSYGKVLDDYDEGFVNLENHHIEKAMDIFRYAKDGELHLFLK